MDVRELLKKTKAGASAWPRELVLDTLSDATAVKLAESPHLASVRSLRVGSGRVGVEGARALATSPYVSDLEVLALPQCHMGDAALVALAKSKVLGKLRSLDITWNEFKARGWKALVESGMLTSLVELRASSNKLGAAGWKTLFASPLASRVEVLGLSMTWPKERGLDALFAAKLPRLRELTAVWVELGPSHVERLVRWAPLSRLTALNLGHNVLGADGVALLLASGRLRSMQRLGLRATEIGLRVQNGKFAPCGVYGVEQLARAKALPSLVAIDLSALAISTEAARLLARAPLLAKVRELVLDGQLDDETVGILRARFGEVVKLPPRPPKVAPAARAQRSGAATAERAEREYIPVAKLASYAKKKPFAHWRPDVDLAIVASSTKLIVAASKELLALGERGTVARQRKVLEACTRGFNALQREHHFITTIEAEDISEAIDQLADHTRLWGSEDLAKQWRDW